MALITKKQRSQLCSIFNGNFQSLERLLEKKSIVFLRIAYIQYIVYL